MAERIVSQRNANFCQHKDHLDLKKGGPQLASHSCTDAKQLPDGGWEETTPRYGCLIHPVKSNVILLDGTVVPYEEYRAN